jgi:hypothetical protein
MTYRKVWLITGADSIGLVEQKGADLETPTETYRRLSLSTTCNLLETGDKPLCAQP